MMEFLSNDCFAAFVTEFAPQIKFCAEWSNQTFFEKFSEGDGSIALERGLGADLHQFTHDALNKDEF